MIMKDRPLLGLTELVTVINDIEVQVIARIDSGATSSSIDSSLAEQLSLKPSIKIKVVKSASGIAERPIVKAKVKIHNVIIAADFTLADRGHMTYPLLIGQNILKEGKFLIDPLKVRK